MIKWLKVNRKIDLTNQELLDAYQKKGDATLFEVFFDRYLELIYGNALSYLKSPTQAQDAVMEIFAKLSTDLRKHKIKHLNSWLFVYTKNHCLGILRKNKRNIEDSSADFMQSEPFEHLNIELDILPDAGTALKDCIDKLKKDQQEVVLKFYFEKQRYKNIAAELNIEFDEVRTKLQNGRRMLKKCLESSGIDQRTYKS